MCNALNKNSYAVTVKGMRNSILRSSHSCHCETLSLRLVALCHSEYKNIPFISNVLQKCAAGIEVYF